VWWTTTYYYTTIYYYVGDRSTYYYVGDLTTYVVDKHHDHPAIRAGQPATLELNGGTDWQAGSQTRYGRLVGFLCGAAGRTGGGDGSWGLYTPSRDDAAPPI
jgi:hypothetical protein